MLGWGDMNIIPGGIIVDGVNTSTQTGSTNRVPGTLPGTDRIVD